MLKKTLFLIFIFTLVVGLSGCIKLSSDKEAEGNPGGVFISGDKGETWVRKVEKMTAGPIAETIGDVNVVNFTFDPSDSRVIYIGTAENGLYYSNNNGKGWFEVEGLTSGFIRGVAVDPNNVCTVYVAVNTRLMKTTTCTRTWEEAYKVPIGELITAVGIDYFNPEIIYIGLDKGDFLKSLDSGLNWERIKNFPSRVNSITFDKDDSRHIYVGTNSSYLYRTMDGGATWEPLRENIEDFKDSGRVISLAQDQKTGSLYYATGYGILRSNDKGDNWEEVKLLTTPSRTNIFSMALNPKNGNEIYYATDTNVFRSLDAGVTWTNWRLPTKRTGRSLAVHPEDANVIYLGVRLYEQ